ncbi:MAG: indole-3-glycerol phosphate synthase TrpC [Proteobacteria bacterium]|nr:indole-3-glycerol phosphate synthase TrpC [Pseudomonadota bacterium]MBU4131107.1 indole-3-glycerol phosphate synthase TrpC [Pseudomonadota bacterium]
MKVEGFLRKMKAVKQEEIDRHRSVIPLKVLRRDAEQTMVPPSFLSAMAKGSRDHVGIIAEIKKASPSKGDIRPDLDVATYVERYTQSGARAISVLTEPCYFKGSLDDLALACKTTDLPVLRKDFIIHEYQIFEGKKAGAAAILLITTLLSKKQQKDYTSLIRDLGMEPLVEINSEWEFEQAYTAGAKVVGINNRNLQTLETDPTIAQRVVKIFPRDIIPVEASGISNRQDIEKGLDHTIFNFLVGESIVRAEDTKAFIRSLCQETKRD